jgi:hypothetical protein
MQFHFAPKADPSAAQALPEIKLFKDDKFNGDCLTCYGDTPYVGNDWNDTCSSIIVVNGFWQCYNDASFQNPTGGPIGPGGYPVLADVGIGNDVISSVKFLHY